MRAPILFIAAILVLAGCQPPEETPRSRAQAIRVCGQTSFVERDPVTGRMWYRTHVGSFMTEWSITEMDPQTPPEAQCPEQIEKFDD